MLGIGLVLAYFGSLDYAQVFAEAPNLADEQVNLWGVTQWSLMTVTCICLFIGAMGKSAQFPLHVWLPDSMEGPTPISALIHAATMVTAGIFMVSRMSPLFELSDTALSFVMVIGAITALFMGFLGIVQNDIKRVVAYSTLSQLGYMTVALAASAYSVAIFHLMTHAFFKALLFLGAGSVIHALAGEQDLRRMGGLRRRIPVTFWTMLVAALAISGIFPLAGFFSKDEILWAAWAGGHPAVWILGLLTAGLTGLYMFRLIFLAFFGEPRHAEGAHPHESPPSMTGPLVALALLSAAGGFIGLPAWLGANRFARFLEPSLSLAHRGEAPHFSHALEFAFAALSVAVALAGIFAAHRIYLARPGAAGRIAARWGAIHRLLRDRYRFDEFYDRAVVRPLLGLSERTLWLRVDVGVIDRCVNGAGSSMVSLGALLRGMQNGLIRSYAAWIVAGMAAVLLYLSLLRS